MLEQRLQMFYEIRGNSINFYDRIDEEDQEDFLRFLLQVPFSGNREDLESTAKEAMYLWLKEGSDSREEYPIDATRPVHYTAEELGTGHGFTGEVYLPENS
jgi:hypothetical protein